MNFAVTLDLARGIVAIELACGEAGAAQLLFDRLIAQAEAGRIELVLTDCIDLDAQGMLQ
ncbi:MAG: hypothetical protein ACOY45_15680 [Pseudomonadota bacterium]